MVVKIEGKDPRTKKGVKGWAGWIPRSEIEKGKFQELVLCSKSRDARRGAGRSGGCDQGYYDGYEEQEQVHEIREMAAEAAKSRDQVRRKLLRTSARKARREFEAD